MFTGPVGPVEVFFTGPKPFWEIFTGLGPIGPLLASSPALSVSGVRLATSPIANGYRKLCNNICLCSTAGYKKGKC